MHISIPWALFWFRTIILIGIGSWHTQCIAFSLWYCCDFASCTGWHTAHSFTAKIVSTKIFLCISEKKQLTHVFAPKTLCISMEKHFFHWKTVHTSFECTTTMGEALINLVHQYPALWDKQDAKYKDSNYKDAKWKDISEILCLTKEDVIKKWNLWGTLLWDKKTSNPKVGMA